MVLGFILASSLLIAPQTNQLGDLLDRAADNARRYTDAMRNLTADETRETEIYAKSGAVQKRRKTRANLVVQQSDASTLAEFLRVFEVDGKAVKEKENSRYELEEMQMYGMSLNQAWPLENAAFRQTAIFKQDGAENIAGRQTVVVRYEYPSKIPEAGRAANMFDGFTPARVFTRGRIWIDAETAEIWRYETETMVEESTLDEPAIWDRMEFYYARSSFGIPTPQKIVWTTFASVSRDRGKLRLARKGKLTAEYGPFRRFGADVKISPVTP
jgi:hypothetical protein